MQPLALHEVPAPGEFPTGDDNVNPAGTHCTSMKKQIILGFMGGFLGILTALFVILSATENDMILSGVQAALLSSLGLMGAAIAKKEARFAGLMLVSSALFITLSVPVANTLTLLCLYMPAVIMLGTGGVLCFMEPVENIPVEP